MGGGGTVGASAGLLFPPTGNLLEWHRAGGLWGKILETEPRAENIQILILLCFNWELVMVARG